MNISEFQLSAFCDRPIKPTADIIIELLQKINKITKISFLPNILSLPTFNLSTGQIDNTQSLAFVTNEQKNTIVYNQNRLDITFSSGLKTDQIDSTFNCMIELVKIFLEYNDLRANRLALNITWSVNSDNICFNSEIERKYIEEFKTLDTTQIKEWSSRILFYKSLEKISLNIIIDINKVSNQTERLPQKIYHLDISK